MPESELVQGMVDILQHQLDVLQRGQQTLITIVGPMGPMGTGWSTVQALPSMHTGLGAAMTAVPPPAAPPGVFVDGTITVVTARLYAIGGSGQSNDVEAFEPNTGSWTAAATLPTPRFGLAVAVGSDHRIYAIGGRSNTGLAPGVLENVVEAFTPGSFHWAPVPGSWASGLQAMPQARERHAAATGQDGRILRSRRLRRRRSRPRALR